MENLLPARTFPAPLPEQTLAKIFPPPFAPITLQRPMTLFKGALGLTPGVASTPDPEFLTRVLSKYSSHQAWLRDLAGDDYKNVGVLSATLHEIAEAVW